jgi:hypothetical protein
LNTTEGVAGDTIDLFMEEKTRREKLQGVDRATRDRHRRETAQKKIDMGKPLTAGVWAATGNHCIDTECMAILHRQREKQNQKELDKVEKEEASKNKLLSQVKAVLSNKQPPEELTLEEWTCPRLKVVCMYYKNKEDKALPSRKNDLFERYKQTRHRRSLDDVRLQSNSNIAVGNISNMTNIDSEGSDNDEHPFIARRNARQKQTAQQKSNRNNIKNTRSISSNNNNNTGSTHQENENDDASEDDGAMVLHSELSVVFSFLNCEKTTSGDDG